MKRQEVRALVNSAIKAVSSKIDFNSGRITEFNSERENTYAYGWLESLSRGTAFNDNQMPTDDWNCVLHVAKKDQPGSKSEEYEAIVDDCDLIAKKITYQINQAIEGYKLLTISNLNCIPFIHKHADDTTGVILSFTLSSPDKTNVC